MYNAANHTCVFDKNGSTFTTNFYFVNCNNIMQACISYCDTILCDTMLPHLFCSTVENVQVTYTYNGCHAQACGAHQESTMAVCAMQTICMIW